MRISKLQTQYVRYLPFDSKVICKFAKVPALKAVLFGFLFIDPQTLAILEDPRLSRPSYFLSILSRCFFNRN